MAALTVRRNSDEAPMMGTNPSFRMSSEKGIGYRPPKWDGQLVETPFRTRRPRMDPVAVVMAVETVTMTFSTPRSG